MAFITKNFGHEFLVQARLEQLTYVQVLELQDKPTPASPRERSVLNLLTHMPQVHPLRTTTACFDLTQSHDHVTIKTDGTTPTFAKNTVVWSVRDGRALTLREMARLLGHDLVGMQGFPESATQFRAMLGNSMHRANTGTILAGAMSAVFSKLCQL
jgi:hypothetical protein